MHMVSGALGSLGFGGLGLGVWGFRDEGLGFRVWGVIPKP